MHGISFAYKSRERSDSPAASCRHRFRAGRESRERLSMVAKKREGIMYQKSGAAASQRQRQHSLYCTHSVWCVCTRSHIDESMTSRFDGLWHAACPPDRQSCVQVPMALEVFVPRQILPSHRVRHALAGGKRPYVYLLPRSYVGCRCSKKHCGFLTANCLLQQTHHRAEHRMLSECVRIMSNREQCYTASTGVTRSVLPVVPQLHA